MLPDALPASLGILLVALILGDVVQVRAAATPPDTRPTLFRASPLLPKAITASPDEEVRLTAGSLVVKPAPEHPDEGDKVREREREQEQEALLAGTRARPLGGRRLAVVTRQAAHAPSAASALALPAPVRAHANQIEPRKKHVEDDDEDEEEDEDDEEDDDEEEEDEDNDEDDNKVSSKDPGKTFKIKKHKLKKWLLPLLVGYKLKFMTLVPLLFATLALLVASAGFAGFFFAMFTAALTLPKHSSGH